MNQSMEKHIDITFDYFLVFIDIRRSLLYT